MLGGVEAVALLGDKVESEIMLGGGLIVEFV